MTLGARDFSDVRGGQYMNVLIVPDTLVIDFQSALRRAEFWEVPAQAGHSATEEGLFFHKDYIDTGLSRFHGSGDPADASSDD
jgi:hypothetical protein